VNNTWKYCVFRYCSSLSFYRATIYGKQRKKHITVLFNFFSSIQRPFRQWSCLNYTWVVPANSSVSFTSWNLKI
jgi:hypothetical protein